MAGSVRLIDKVDREAVELEERLEKLNAFLWGDEFGKLSPEHRLLLRRQAKHMESYFAVLLKRVRLLESEDSGAPF